MNWVLTTAVVAMSVAAAVAAQSPKAMHQPSKGDTNRMTYTGCVESFNHGAGFLLTKIDDAAESMHGDKSMKHDGDMAMKHDETAMKSGAATTMRHQQTPMVDEKMDGMPPKAFALAGSADLRKHVGQKVSVTGSLSDGSMGTTQGVSTLTIKTLKVMAKSCS